MKFLMTTLSLAALLGATAPAFAVSAGTFDPRDPNSLTRPAQQDAQKPYALTGSSRRSQEPNDSRLQVNNQLGGRAVITTHDDAQQK